MKLSRIVLAAGLLLAMVTSALADQATGRVRVRVLDQTGQPFPGVVVTLSNNKGLQPPQSLKSNAKGEATFGVVQAGGGYKITIAMEGFATIEDFFDRVAPEQTKELPYVLSEERIERIQVEGRRPIADLDEPTNTTSISGEFFNDLPILGRNYQSALTLAPAVNDADEDGNPNVHGARERDFKATVDGISNVDPLTGTFMSNINPDAIEEIQVVTSGADASYGRAVGGFAKIITKTGSNDFEGVFKMTYRTSKLDGNGARSGDVGDFDLYQPSVSLTGKIVRDKLFYALNHEYLDRGDPISLVGARSLVVQTEAWRHLDKITWQVTPRNKLNFQYSADPLTVQPLGVDSLTDPRSGLEYEQGGPTYSITWQTPVSSRLNITSIVGWSDTGIAIRALSQDVENTCVVDPLASLGERFINRDYCLETRTARRSGSWYYDYEDMRQRLTVKSDATLFVENFLGKDHTFDFGIIAEDEHFENDAIFRPFSTYQDEAFRTGIQFGETVTAGGLLVRTVFSPGAPDTLFREADGLTVGVYAQDTFRPHPRVSIKTGVRFERESIDTPGVEPMDPRSEHKRFFNAFNLCYDPQRDPPRIADTCTRIALENFTVFEDLPCPGHPLCPRVESFANPRFRQPDTINLTNYNLAPKFSISWDPKGDGRTKLFGTYGKTYDKIFLGVPVAEQGPYSFTQLFEVTATQVPLPDGSFEVIPVVDNFPQSVSPPTVNQVSRDLRTPYVNEITMGISREIAPETGLTFTYVRRRYKDLLQDIDLNHFAEDKGDNDLDCLYDDVNEVFIAQGKPDGLFDDCGGGFSFRGSAGGFGGRPIFVDSPDGIPDLRLYNPLFNSVFLIGNFNSTDYTSYTLELVRRLHHNWEMEASYVWSKAVGDAEDFQQALGDDPTTVQDEKGFLEYDQRHIVKVNARTLLPLWRLRLGMVGRWESGQPFSLIRVAPSRDRLTAFGTARFGYVQSRTSYPTRQRNDHRNESFFTLDVNAQRDFQIGKVNLTATAEIFNLLNNDRLRVAEVRNGFEVAERRFGRRFQMSMKVNF